jgi:predicted enzyme related to lactoylglutathione lyase
MGERSSYTPGTFCWVELTTSDQPAAKSFYGELFGWGAADMPMDDQGSVYSMMQLGGKDVAAISPQPKQQREAGAPSMWNSYVSVQDADATLARASKLGATAHAPAFDVFDAGRMAVIQDPQGAFFELWQPRGHFGAARVNEPGAFCWNELMTPDLDASKSFYGELFGWGFEPFEASPMRYELIKNGEAGNGGIGQPQQQTPPSWLVYFGVADIDAAVAQVGELGGRTFSGPDDIGIAKIAVVADPQGAVFALYDGQFVP